MSSSSRDRSRDRRDRSRGRHASRSPGRRRSSPGGNGSGGGRPPVVTPSYTPSYSSSRDARYESSSSSSTSGSATHRRGSSTTGGRGQYEEPSGETRLAYFIKSCAFLVDMGKALNLGKVATHTALVFFHRFFKVQSFQAHDRLLVAAACIYLAAKVEERNNVKLSMIVVEYLKKTQALPADVDLVEYTRNATARELVPAWKSRVITYERTILYTIAFDLTVTHPFKALQDMMKTVKEILAEEGKKPIPPPTSSFSSAPFSSTAAFDHRLFFSQACNFLNDSFCLPSMIEMEPSYSAALALYLTAMLYDIKPPAHKEKTWMDILKIQDERRFLEDCKLAVQTYAAESFVALHAQDVPDPLCVALAPMEETVVPSYGGGKRKVISPLLY